jgi:hypothetical protein
MQSNPRSAQTLSMVIADTIRAELARRRLKARDLAPALGLMVRAVERRLSGEVAFELDELPVVADFFGMRLSDLVQSFAPIELQAAS